MPAAVIVGSAFRDPNALGPIEPLDVLTPAGSVRLYRHLDTDGLLLFRHGLPHRWLPHQVPYRAHALALQALGCHALLVTSSVGVLDPQLPLYQPHLLADLLMLDNRLPDGSACTIWPEPTKGQGHLVVREGLFSPTLSTWLQGRADLPGQRLTFLYVGGPRTKTRAENRMAATLGAEVNSMSLGPEIVLANELEIPCAGLVIGHKYSVPGGITPDRAGIAGSLEQAMQATAQVVRTFLAEAPAVAFGNVLYRFDEQRP